VATHSANPGSIVRSAAPHFGPASESLVDLLHQTRPNDNMFTGRTAISVEFVCKPNQAQRVCALIPKAINETFAGLSGFAGCALMVSDHEERLITVLTFWHGERRSASLNENARWVCKLLEPYMDHKLRVQTMRSHLAMLPGCAFRASSRGASRAGDALAQANFAVARCKSPR